MGATVVVVRSVNARPTVADGWRGGTGWAASGFSDVIFVPPASLEDVGRRSALIVLALPADELFAALISLRGAISPEAAIVSTCLVVSLERIRCLVGPAPSLFRVIVPSGIDNGEGVAALAPEPGTVREVVERVTRSLAWIGAVEVVSEEALDAVAAIALGGAAFMCAALEGLEEGAVSEGLPRATARSFAHQTALATALLLREHPGSPADLKDQVASPGGTTIVALATLEDAAVRGAFIRAVQRSASRVRAGRDAARPSVIE
jgi:pyrroline-5-carboxylate reductase